MHLKYLKYHWKICKICLTHQLAKIHFKINYRHFSLSWSKNNIRCTKQKKKKCKWIIYFPINVFSFFNAQRHGLEKFFMIFRFFISIKYWKQCFKEIMYFSTVVNISRNPNEYRYCLLILIGEIFLKFI